MLNLMSLGRKTLDAKSKIRRKYIPGQGHKWCRIMNGEVRKKTLCWPQKTKTDPGKRLSDVTFIKH